MVQYTVPLSILDQKMPLWHTSIFLTFATDNPHQTFQNLRQGLNLTTRQLPFLSGEVLENAEDHDRSELIWNDEATAITISWEQVSWPANAQPTPAYADLVARRMPLHEYFESLRPLSFLNTLPGHRLPGQAAPVLILSYTEIMGGLIVFFGAHHHVMDEGGREILLHLWAKNTKNAAQDLHYCNRTSGQADLTRTSDPATAIEPSSATSIPRDEPCHRVEKLTQMLNAARQTQTAPKSLARTTTIKRDGIDEDALSVPPPGPPPPLTAKLFRFSVAKISALRKVLSTHMGQDISLNILVSCYVWASISQARYLRLKQNNDYGLELDELVSQLVMAANLRSRFEEHNIFPKGEWIGNLTLPLTPMPCMPFEFLRDLDRLQLSIDLDGQRKSICVPGSLPGLIESLNIDVASLSASRAAKMLDALEPGNALDDTSYSYRSLRSPNIAVMNGLNIVLTAWSNFDYYPDFGSGIGRPEFIRPSAGPPIADGLVVFLPRKRAAQAWSAKEVDTFEVLAKLREDDMKVFEADEALRALLVED